MVERREFLGTAFGALSAAVLSAQTRSGDMIYRPLGKTGEKVSAIGLGGHHIGRPADKQEGIRLIRTAIDRGITFMDNCWDYHDGKSEVWMGEALRDGYRQKVFLMTKYDGRTKASAARQIDESLRRLETDRIDLIQYHENIRLEDPDRYFAPGGPHEAVMEAKKAGKIRFFGFTGHKDPYVHLRILELAAKNGVHFDTAQMPLNILDAQFRSFARDVVPKLVEQGVGVLGMKPMADGSIPKNNIATGLECLQYALSLPTSVVITGCETLDRLEQALQAAKNFQPLSQTQLSAILARTKEASLSGKFELFKTGARFDGTASHPQWMS
jgi:aryl-alcohol dehydrogenase-like predicted oxidoreductase